MGLAKDEPENWTKMGKNDGLRLSDKEVKHQEQIYEFILTEKHHCMVLLAMDGIFSEGNSFTLFYNKMQTLNMKKIMQV